MMSYCVNVNFWPVGQGLFSSGCIKTAGSESYAESEFHWIYDCGSMAKYLVNAAVKAYETKVDPSNGIINLVAISHFDYDHINGLAQLLTTKTVEYLFLPYMPLWQRLLIAAQTEIDLNNLEDAKFFEYLIDPVMYLSSRYGRDGTERKNAIREIVFVPSSRDVIVDKDTFREAEMADGTLQFIKDSLSSSNSSETSIKTSLIAYGESAIFRGLWEFLPYNDANLSKKITKSFRLKIESLADKFKNNPNKNKILEDIKTEYRSVFKKGKIANKISLFMYSGPVDLNGNIKKYGLSRLNYFNIFNRCLSKKIDVFSVFCYLNDIYMEEIKKTAILYTGDGFLTASDELDRLEAFLGVERMINIFIFQVMHHGSKKNWHLGVADKITPNWSIFNANPNVGNRHPDPEVLRDFISCNPILVNEKGAHFYMIF